MKNVKFKNQHFDPTGSPFILIAEQMAKAYGYTASLSINKQLAQLIRLRVALVNECIYCAILHQAEARKQEIEQAKIDNLNSYWHSELFTEQEKAVLQYTDVVNEGKNRNFESYHTALLKFYTANEIAEIAFITINMNLWTRIKLAQGQAPYFE